MTDNPPSNAVKLKHAWGEHPCLAALHKCCHTQLLASKVYPPATQLGGEIWQLVPGFTWISFHALFSMDFNLDPFPLVNRNCQHHDS